LHDSFGPGEERQEILKTEFIS